MERIEIQCDAKTVWKAANKIVYQTIQCYEIDLCSDKESYEYITERNKRRIRPFKFTSKVGFYKKNLNGLIVYITFGKKWWHTIPTETDKATLVIYLPKMFNMLKELRKEIYRLKSDEERNI